VVVRPIKKYWECLLQCRKKGQIVRAAVWGGGLAHVGPRKHHVDGGQGHHITWGQSHTNPFATASGNKTTMPPFVKIR